MTKWIAATFVAPVLAVAALTGALVASGPSVAHHGSQAQEAIFTQEIGYQPAVTPR